MKVNISFIAEVSDKLVGEGQDIALSTLEEHILTLLEGREYEEEQIFQSYQDLEIEPQETEEEWEASLQDNEDEIEQQRRDEKNDLYPDRADIAN
jgi:hypothetical protein